MRLFAASLALLAFLAALPPQAEAAQRKMEDMGIVVMRTIDKSSARTHTFEIPVDKTVKFGNSLFIKVRACRRSSPLDSPESAAFMQIWERKPNEKDSKWVFSGWMFASSPSVSAMDHPVYDVWVIECKNAATSAKASETFSSEKTPEHTPEEDAAAKGKQEVEDEGVDTEAAPDHPEKPEAASAPAESTAPVTPTAPADSISTPAPAAKPSPMPPIEQLPGSFDDSEAVPD